MTDGVPDGGKAGEQIVQQIEDSCRDAGFMGYLYHGVMGGFRDTGEKFNGVAHILRVADHIQSADIGSPDRYTAGRIAVQRSAVVGEQFIVLIAFKRIKAVYWAVKGILRSLAGV